MFFSRLNKKKGGEKNNIFIQRSVTSVDVFLTPTHTPGHTH
jgi:hypothetical protein